MSTILQLKLRWLFKMIISLIAAMGKNRVIGKDNDLPWGRSLPTDMQYFHDITLNKPVVMGRKTYESLGKPLSNRTNIIITRDQNYKAEGCIVVHSADEALKAAGNVKEVMVIGGSQIYKEFLPRSNRIYLTKVDSDFDGDTFFPEYDIIQWKEISYEEHKKDAENQYDYAFVVMERKN